MNNKLYVGNLSYTTTDEDLKGLFSKFGSLQSANVIMDKYSGRSKGFGFVEFASTEEASKALELNGSDFMGRNITVSEARPQEPRQGGGGYGGGGGRRGGGGGFGGGGYGGGGGRRGGGGGRGHGGSGGGGGRRGW
ncbi:MAG: RNA-binding protein [Candidatus Omnitrophica bacterium]|nr:RNA-binding protein [Candidatus Omnitrophota bacterium]